MRVLVVKQPWASLIVSGQKPLEVRSWLTHYRGPVLIVASKRPEARKCAHVKPHLELRDSAPCGVALGVVDLVDCIPGEKAHMTRTGGIDPTGHYCWVFANPQPVRRQVKTKGRLGLYNAEPKLLAAVGAL